MVGGAEGADEIGVRGSAGIGKIELPANTLRITPQKGDRQNTWAVRISGNWRVRFRFAGPDVTDVNYEDYHCGIGRRNGIPCHRRMEREQVCELDTRPHHPTHYRPYAPKISLSPSSTSANSSGDAYPNRFPMRPVDSVRSWRIFTQERFAVALLPSSRVSGKPARCG